MAVPPVAVDGIHARRGRHVTDRPHTSIVILVMKDTTRLEMCLDSISDHVAATDATEVLVLANGTTGGALAVVQEREDIVLIRSRVNHGFGGGCNWAVRFARGDRLVFLNDDVQVTEGWLEALHAGLDSAADVGVVGSRILLADGRLQEAGSVIWRDGITHGVGRGGDPDSPHFLVRRAVDYVSFCSAMVRREAWESIGGFDERYFPAYYEDADLCLGLREAGWRTVYEPRSVVRHAESASTGLRFRHFLAARNRQRFVAKWATTLSVHEEAPAEGERNPAILRALRRAGGGRPALLMIDDCEPDPGLGTGFGRMHDAVVQLSADFEITFIASYLTVNIRTPWMARRRDRTRELLGDLGVLLLVGEAERHIRAAPEFDAAIISRPTNYAAFAQLLRRKGRGKPLIYDTESLWHRRLFRQSALADGEVARRLHAEATAFQRIEEEAVRAAAMVICITKEEADLARALRGDSRVAVVAAHLVGATVTPGGFHQRRPHLLFAASWLAGRDSPNLSALRWMAGEVMPAILSKVPWARLLVTGANPPPEVSALDGPSVSVMGFVTDVADLYSGVRVVVCPMLAGAGIKLKVIEALQSGVPTVSTSIGAEGIDSAVKEALHVSDDAAGFAQRCVTLLTDPAEWSTARSAALAYDPMRSAADGERSASSWRSVVEAAMGRVAAPSPSRS